MYIEEFNGEATVLGAVIMAIISAFCSVACIFMVGVDNLKSINDSYTIYYIMLSLLNGMLCLPPFCPTFKFIATVFITFLIPLIHLFNEKTTLMGADVLCLPVIAANLFILLCCIAQWCEETVDEVMKKLNGSDPYFIRIRDKILKRCGDNDLRWGVENLSIGKLLKLKSRARILDEEEKIEKYKEERERMAYKEKSERRKINFLNRVDI